MNLVFLFSVILKGLGAVMEVLLQITITGCLGVSGYGTYAAWISFADLLFWVFFSGLVKCNTFYLSARKSSIRSFKRKYYLCYALPVIVLLLPIGIGVSGSILFGLVPLISSLELLVMDRSSTLLTRGKSGSSLFGEYVLGRVILLTGAAVLSHLERLDLQSLLLLYVLQYCVVLSFLLLRQGRSRDYADISGEVSLRKWGAYQRSDLMVSMIEFMPVVMQYFFSGAFEAGVLSVLLLVKKLINFVSGPTAKIFLPEFSRLYKAGAYADIRRVYGNIMRIQMLFVGPMAVVLLGFPRVILRILAEELVSYDLLFMCCSVIFLVVASLGPCSGILLMTDKEKTENRIRCCALMLMAAVMLLTSRDPWFVLYGLCAEVGAEAAMKFICMCRWMKKAPTSLGVYLGWWAAPAAAIGLAHVLKAGDSFWMMVVFAGLVFAFFGLRELKETAFFKRK